MSNEPVNPSRAFYEYLCRFQIPVYAAASVPSDAQYPYMTFIWVMGEWDKGEVNIQTNLYYYTESEAVPNAKARQMFDDIGRGGVLVPCDTGALWIKRGSPFSQVVVEENDMVKRRLINISLEYLAN